MIVVDAFCNIHTHLREPGQAQDLIRLAVDGGADTLLPMPNVGEGLTGVHQVIHYNKHLLEAEVLREKKVNFIPTIMVNEYTMLEDIDLCVKSGIFDAKIYPRDRTTKSSNGTRQYGRLLNLIKHCSESGMRVHFHPEHPWMLFDNRDAEFAFLPIIDMFLNETQATIIWEHGTDARCIPFWKQMAEESGRFYVTLTPHHLATDEDETFGDVRAVCKPPIKTRRDKNELISLVAENNPWVMAGADDAPHPVGSKHTEEGRCACGAYTAPFALPLYAHALHDVLSRLDGWITFTDFTSRNARKLFGIPPALRGFELVQEPFSIPGRYQIGSWTVLPFWAGQTLKYSIKEIE